MHEKYGEVVRIAPDELSFISPGAWNDIYGIKSGKSFVRDPKWYANLTEGQDDIIVANETKRTCALRRPFLDLVMLTWITRRRTFP